MKGVDDRGRHIGVELHLGVMEGGSASNYLQSPSMIDRVNQLVEQIVILSRCKFGNGSHGLVVAKL